MKVRSEAPRKAPRARQSLQTLLRSWLMRGGLLLGGLLRGGLPPPDWQRQEDPRVLDWRLRYMQSGSTGFE